jgi:hypothetical protein
MATENEREKRNRETIRRLRSGRKELILETVRELRQNGNRDIMPDVIGLISAGSNDEVTDACVSLLNDIKDRSSAQVISEFIRKDRKRRNLDRIVAACWQNGQDYSGDIDLFIDLVLEEDYATAVEAFTVVEQNIHPLSISQRQEKAVYIESRISEISQEKRSLVRELIAILKTFQSPLRPDLN